MEGLSGISELVSGLGLPVAMAVFFVYQNKLLNDKFIELVKKTTSESAASTEAINQASRVIEKNTEVFHQIKPVLSSLQNGK